MKFSEADLEQIEKKGLTPKKVKQQVKIFKNGLPFTHLIAAATIGKGITKLTSEEEEAYIKVFEDKKNESELLKFVPASGAATRMFKFLFEFIHDYNPEEESLNSYINNTDAKDLSLFFLGLKKFPFYDEVKAKLLEVYPNYETMSRDEKSWLFVKAMLDEDMLDYGNYPKGLLPFHEYKNKVISTAFEEHLFETALYSSDNTKAKLHFTISEKFKDKFKKEFDRIQQKVETKTGVTFEISFSYQKESTDTIAVTSKNKLFREEDGALLFRPSGHGALIENLNDLEADVIFMKNIDNVVVYKYKEEVAKYKKVLAGILMELQEQAFAFLRQLDEGKLKDDEIKEIAKFLAHKMEVKISPEFKKYKSKYQVAYLKEKLNRPIRICGMVKNEGEPGGGPFWVKDEAGAISLQIVESAQINMKDKGQKSILTKSTHFNPVDIVCSVKDYKGNKFNLTKYVDPSAAFITMKTKNGKNLKALELPGLWNGSMANWNTVFVEVPLITFNPVKTVNDLLKAPHQVLNGK